MILIIAFAGLNIFLAYHLFWPDMGRLTRVKVSAEDLDNLEVVLEENNYHLQVSLDRAARKANFLSVSTAFEFQRALILRMLENGAELKHTGEGTFCRNDEQSVVIEPTGLIKVYFTPAKELGQGFAEADRPLQTSAVEDFLDKQSLKPQGLAFDYVAEEDRSGTVWHYYQVIDEGPVFTGNLKVYTEEDKVRRVEVYWLDLVESDQGKEMEVISAVEAVRSLVRDLGPAAEESLITEVRLGHFSAEYDAEKWEIPPVWRIVLQNDLIYYINAFTGNPERKSAILEQLS